MQRGPRSLAAASHGHVEDVWGTPENGKGARPIVDLALAGRVQGILNWHEADFAQFRRLGLSFPQLPDQLQSRQAMLVAR